jgi:hypothetical protein
MMKKMICLLLLALMGFSPLAAASLEDLTGTGQAAELLGGGIITKVQLKEPQPLLTPRHPELRRLVDDLMRSLEPGLFVESLYRYGKPAGAADGWTEEERTRLYNEILALSTLTGIQYYSTSRKTMRTFYEYSHVIDGADTKRPLPDPVFAEVPQELRLYARQKDLTFGDNIYQYDYLADADSLIFVQRNLSAMNVGIIPAVGKNRLHSVVAVIDAGDSLLVYAASMVKAASLPGLGGRIGNSFTSRAEAVLQWFSGRADKAFGK